MYGTPSSLSYRGGAYPTSQHITVVPVNVPSPVDQGFHFSCDIGELGRRTKGNAIGFKHLFNAFKRHIIFYGAALILILFAFFARNTAMDLLSCKLIKLRLYNFPFYLRKYTIKQNSRVSIL